MEVCCNGASLILSLTCVGAPKLKRGFENEDDLNLLLLDNIMCLDAEHLIQHS